MNTKITNSRIFAGLTQFGLDPREWAPQSPLGTKNSMVIFKHKDDHKFQLLGIFDQASKVPKLKDLQVFSI